MANIMAEPLSFKQALSVLSNSSPYAVSTLRKNETEDYLLKIKNYLYITPDIENEFKDALENSKSGDIFYLCGSSGDGKSEVLTNLYKEFEHRVKFHLDATHSNSQHGSAVDNLNDMYDEFKETKKTLAIGINIGMMQKFIKQGADRHNDIKGALIEFFENRHAKGFIIDNVQFFDFECYPRITFDYETITSKFVMDFLAKLTTEHPDNPFWTCYLAEKGLNTQLSKNYEILGLKSFQASLVELFGLIRLTDEQFLTPRTFVDFINQILVNENKDGIAGNLFNEIDNELSSKLLQWDPNNLRKEGIDDFYLEYATQTLSSKFQKIINTLNEINGANLSPQGVIRLLYMLRYDEALELIPEKLIENFTVIEERYYLKLIDTYSKNKLERSDEDDYLDIVEDILVKAIFKYTNRKLKEYNPSYLVNREVNGYLICNKTDIQADLEWVESNKLKTTDSLPVPLIVNGKSPIIFELDFKLLKLALNICNGFKPNRQEQGVLMKFDELISQIIMKTSDSDSLLILRKDGNKSNAIYVSKSSRRYTVEGSL